MVVVDLTHGTVSPPNPGLLELVHPPKLKGRLPGHTVLMWDLDAPSCTNVDDFWLHMICEDRQIHYRSPCPPDARHKYCVAQFKSTDVDFDWEYGCVKIPANPVGPVAVFSVQKAENVEACGSYHASVTETQSQYGGGGESYTPRKHQIPSRRRRIASYKSGDGRGSRTRGWRIDAPAKGRERQQLYEKCGDKCFLKPDSLGFPVCKRCIGGECDCDVDCRGVAAAKVRAHQWRYTELYDTVNSLESKYCK